MYFESLQVDKTSGMGRRGQVFVEHLRRIPKEKLEELSSKKIKEVSFFCDLLTEYGFRVISEPNITQVTIAFESIKEKNYMEEWLKIVENIEVASNDTIGKHDMPYIRMVFTHFNNFSSDFFIDLVAAMRGIQDNIKGKISSDTAHLSRSGYLQIEHALKHYFPKGKIDQKKFSDLPRIN